MFVKRPNFELNINEDPAERRKATWTALAGGISMLGAAALGVLGNEAETPQDAIGSINIADRTYYVQAEEIPFIALGGLGGTITLFAAEYMRKDEEE